MDYGLQTYECVWSAYYALQFFPIAQFISMLFMTTREMHVPKKKLIFKMFFFATHFSHSFHEKQFRNSFSETQFIAFICQYIPSGN